MRDEGHGVPPFPVEMEGATFRHHHTSWLNWNQKNRLQHKYRKVSNIRRAKFQNISDSRTVLHVVFAQSIEAMY